MTASTALSFQPMSEIISRPTTLGESEITDAKIVTKSSNPKTLFKPTNRDIRMESVFAACLTLTNKAKEYLTVFCF